MKIERPNVIHAAEIAAGYLIIFLLGKLLNSNPGMPLDQWLLDSNPANHSYLFGWLIIQERYWKYSVVSVFSAMLGMPRFGWSTFWGYSIGLLLGEVCTLLWKGSLSTGFFPVPWLIWFGCLCLYIVLCVVLEFRNKKK